MFKLSLKKREKVQTCTMATNINVTSTTSIANKYGLPQLEESQFEHWKHEIEMWQIITDVTAAKQGPLIYLSLSGKARQAWASLTKKQLNCESGVETLLAKLEELYAKDKDQATFEAYEKFETFRRDRCMNMRDFIEFERLNDSLRSFEINLPDAVLAYQLLKNANLPDDKRDLARATVSPLTFNDMKRQIKSIYDHCAVADSELREGIIKVEPDDVYYGGRFENNRRGNRGGNNRGWRGNRGNRRSNDRRDKENDSERRTNPIDPRTGYPSKCAACKSIYHWVADCPDASPKDVNIQLFTKETSSEYLQVFVSETLNSALLDSGCSSTVCGKNWLKCYLDSIGDKSLTVEPSTNQFRFGDGKIFHSKGKINIPASIGATDVFIRADIVNCEIPLLLSKDSMKSADTKLDFAEDKVTMYGQDIMLNITSNGHYCVPISRKQAVLNAREKNVNPSFDVNLSINELPTKSKNEKEAVAIKLHKQFGHPIDSDRLKKLLRDAQIADTELEEAVDKITETCNTCARYKKANLRPVVAFDLGKEFNDVLALDLKFINKYIILHMIDTFTRYSQACIVESKKKEVIVRAILQHWVSIFGAPSSIFSDNGGEFNNDL